MPFQERFDEIIKKAEVPTEKQLWIDSISFGFLTFAISLFYLYITRDTLSLRTVNQALAWSSVILIGLSFALSGLCYFWDFVDRKILYRKHIGLVGFWLGVLHTLLTFYNISNRFGIIPYLSDPEHKFPFLMGVIALIIFAVMAAISNRYAIHELGGTMWRRTLRFGYFALFLSLLHFIFAASLWSTLLLTLFVVFVLGLRVALEVSLRRKKSEAQPVSRNFTPLPKSLISK